MWLPRFSWFIPTKYTVKESERCCGIISGAVFTDSNAKTATVNDPAKAWEILAAALILSEDEVG